jgi:hypothetical protein
LLNNASHIQKEWKFIDISKSARVTEPYGGFPTWMWDYNNDGWIDIYASSYDYSKLQKVGDDEARYMLGLKNGLKYPSLYKNNGDLSFTDVTNEVGLQRPMYPMGANFGDIDNDGFLDFYLGTGAPDLRSAVPNLMFHNKGGVAFDEITYTSGTAHIQKGHGVGFADMDNDGDQDIYVVMGGAYTGDIFFNALFENSNESNNWITLKLEGTKSNRAAIGSRIRVETTDENGKVNSFYSTVSTGGSFGSSSLQQEMGLGKAVKINEIEITWANQDQTKQKFYDVPMNKAYHIREGDEKITSMELRRFEYSSNPGGHHHHH